MLRFRIQIVCRMLDRACALCRRISSGTKKYGRFVAPVSSVATLIGVYIAVESLSSSQKILENQEDNFAWRTMTNPRPGNSGIGAALKHLNEKGVSLDRVYMQPAGIISTANAQNISNSRPNVYIGPTKLDGIRLRNSWLSNANFSGASLRYADMRGVTIEGTNFSKSILESADLTNASGRNAIFSGASLRYADMRGVTIEGTNFSKSILESADLTNASGRNAIFSDSVMEKIKLVSASLPEAKLNRASMIFANAKKIKLREAHALATRFDGADLSGGELLDIIALGASFVKSTLDDVDLENAGLRGSSFEGASLKRANLTNAIVSFTNMTNADMRGIIVEFASFTGANMSNVKIDGARGLNEATWRGAWMWDDSKIQYDHDGWKKIASGFRVYDNRCRDEWKEQSKLVEQNAISGGFISRYGYPPEQCRKDNGTPSAVK